MKSNRLTPEQEELLDLRDQVYDLTQENIRLQRVVDQLKTGVVKRQMAGRKYVFPTTWNLRPQEADLLSILIAAEGNTVLYTVAISATTQSKSTLGDAVLKTTMSTLRRKIANTGLVIQCEWGRGYRIDRRTLDKFMKQVYIVRDQVHSSEDGSTTNHSGTAQPALGSSSPCPGADTKEGIRL